ncbi:MAG: response regulator [Anaerolineales bacterium]
MDKQRTNSGHPGSGNITWSDNAFVLEVRHALRNIYDQEELKKSALVSLLSLDETEVSPSIQNIVVSAVLALKPDSSLSSQSDAWRIYNIIHSRYIQQFQQGEVARSVGLSARQMRRLDRLALKTLAEYLWTHYRKEPQSKSNTAFSSGETELEDAESSVEKQPNEINWLEQSQIKEVISVPDLAGAIMKTIEPLTRSLSISVEYDLPADLPDVVVKLLPLRQAVLTLLTTLLNHCHGGKIVIRANRHLQYDQITLNQVSIVAEQFVLETDMRESTQIASQLLALSGGAVEILPSKLGTGFEQIILSIPISEQVVVLVIDDNQDALLLFQRYLARTQYLFIGARSFERAMAVIERTVPDIIISDVMMRDIDGWELLERLREDPKTHDRPVIICSILPQEQLAFIFGAAAFIRKPITQESLLKSLDDLSWRIRQKAG